MADTAALAPATDWTVFTARDFRDLYLEVATLNQAVSVSADLAPLVADRFDEAQVWAAKVRYLAENPGRGYTYGAGNDMVVLYF